MFQLPTDYIPTTKLAKRVSITYHLQKNISISPKWHQCWLLSTSSKIHTKNYMCTEMAGDWVVSVQGAIWLVDHGANENQANVCIKWHFPSWFHMLCNWPHWFVAMVTNVWNIHSLIARKTRGFIKKIQKQIWWDTMQQCTTSRQPHKGSKVKMFVQGSKVTRVLHSSLCPSPPGFPAILSPLKL